MCDPLNYLQPLLDVLLHVQRSEYCSDVVFVDNGVRAVAELRRNFEHVRVRDARFVEKELANSLMPVVNPLVVAVLVSLCFTIHEIPINLFTIHCTTLVTDT